MSNLNNWDIYHMVLTIIILIGFIAACIYIVRNCD